jgi:hypothetical protein
VPFPFAFARLNALQTAVRHSHNGRNIVDTAEASPLYNDNKLWIKWSHNMTTKQIRHMKMWENAVCEWFHYAFLKVFHVSGWINPADIFTKEMRDGAHFQPL